MNPEIKQRIDQIRQGEVPEGYKKTKAGIVPSEWSCFTFGDIYAERKEAGDSELPILTVSIHSGVSDGALDEDEIGKKVKRIEDKTQYKKAHSGDLVFNMMRAWQGAIGVVRTKGLVSPAYIVANPKNSVYPLYMDFYMKTAEVINRIHRKSYGVTDFRLRLYWDSFAIIDCALPPLPEQQKIAEILTTQDKLIELQARKIEQLHALKKAYLQRMFPKKGCDRPEIRFAGFADAWEQRELGEVTEDFVEKSTVENQYPVLTSSQQKGIVLQDDYFAGDRVSQSGNLGYFIIPRGYFAYRSRSDNDVFVFNRNDCVDMGIISYFYPVFKPKNVDSDFLLRRLNNGLETQLRISSEGTGQHVLSLKKFKSMTTFFPSIPEQQQIGTYFRNLDNLITLHQRKLDEEKQKKKALMQLLLTGIVRVKI